jgi:hypothetical protein
MLGRMRGGERAVARLGSDAARREGGSVAWFRLGGMRGGERGVAWL